ncbi:acyltransferase [Paenisporosarcina macmurdoensis]|uniref:Acyltransferase n=1 Tax=Paenisporosarcina macmurdoensis TaxID=212659 RepID=A0ABW1L9Z6_9BACL
MTLIKKNPNTKVIIEDKVRLGVNIVLGPQCKEIKIGFGTFIGDNVYIDIPYLSIGEYTSIHKSITIHGYLPCSIGHNCWIGEHTIIDSIGGTTIGNNVGVGTYSQLWSHMKFGDMMKGCRWNISKPLVIEDDVWLVGHCIVSPITAKKGSLLMVGGVITKDMEENRVYGGSPAKDLTDKIGTQFKDVSIIEKKSYFNNLYIQFLSSENINKNDYPIVLVEEIDKKVITKFENVTQFCLNDQTYVPTYSELEYKFIKYMLYDRAKFIPIK